MKKTVAPLLVMAFAFACGYATLRAMGQPWFWRSQIAAFEKADRANPPRAGVIVFTGSSSIRFWHSLAQDMAPLEVINRGFGGSEIAEVNYFAPKIVLPYKPRAVVLYCGDNDLAWPWHKSPEKVLADFQEFVRIVRGTLPETWIYFISMKPSPRRWNNWEREQTANRMIADYIHTQERVEYIDVTPVMLDGQGRVRKEIFRMDGLHMNAKGYELWTGILKPILLKRFGPENQGVALDVLHGSQNLSDGHSASR